MAEYIDRDETIRLVNAYIDSSYERADNSGYHEARAEGFEELLDDVFNLPTIELVHCKYCRYSNVYALDSYEEPRRWCRRGLVKVVNDNDYCSWGEK